MKKTMTILILTGLAVTSTTFAHNSQRGCHRDMQLGYKSGVCVGQALAEQQIKVPTDPLNRQKTLDDATKAAMMAAEQECIAQLIGTTDQYPSQPPTQNTPSYGTPSQGTPAAGPSGTPSQSPAPNAPSTPTPTPTPNPPSPGA